MWACFAQGALRIINLDSLGDKKYDQIILMSEEWEGWGPETSSDCPERCQVARMGKGSTLQSQDGQPPPARAEQPQGKSHSYGWQVRLSPLSLCA